MLVVFHHYLPKIRFLNQNDMSNKKLILNHYDDDSEPESLIARCFQVSSDVKYREVPTTGEEYLLSVMRERENCAAVTRCKQDYSKFAKNQDCFIVERPRAKVHEKIKPTIEWQNLQVADFSEIRMYIGRLVAKKSQWPRHVAKIELEQTNLIGWKHFFSQNEPTLTTLLGLKHTILDLGLESLTAMLNEVRPGNSIDHKTGQWIYSFLACTRQPLLSETICILRDLARKCAEIRSRLNPDSENAVQQAAPMNLFICLVARYFRQHDLAD